MSWQPPPPPPGSGQAPQPNQAPPPGQAPAKPKAPQNYYQILLVDPAAHPTIIRYAYRFLAATYHPDNSDSGDGEKFRIITEAWRTLSDPGRRQSYDIQIGIHAQKEAAFAAEAAAAALDAGGAIAVVKPPAVKQRGHQTKSGMAPRAACS